MRGSLTSAASRSSQSCRCSTFCFLRGASGSGASSARRRRAGRTLFFCTRFVVDADCVKVRRGAVVSEGRFFGMTAEGLLVVWTLEDICLEARGLDAVDSFATTTDGFLLSGRLAPVTVGFSVLFLTTALVMSPSADFLWAFVTSPRAARFLLGTVALVVLELFPTLEGRVVVVTISDEASFERVTRVCCSLFSSCNVG